MLVPTTVLARQHYQTAVQAASRRFPVDESHRAAPALPHGPDSRRRSLRTTCPRGEVDLVVGTHRLLSKDRCSSSDLGLLIIDEEQRFGVAHKERLKELFTRRRRTHAFRHPHPPHAQHGALRHPGYVCHRGSAAATGIRCQTYVLEHDDRRYRGRNPQGAAPRRAGLLPAQPTCRRIERVAPPGCRQQVPRGPHCRLATAR